ncbi:hypothetical protein LIER_33026 [Lithospermum erythrorhizon]|uniref:Glutathione S-transferase n=1 Tax=Lithospermum erythrorhizon TaxID=34254 RepID=A0AAV3RX84_LITER
MPNPFFMSTPMLIGPASLMTEPQPLLEFFSSVTILSPGVPENNDDAYDAAGTCDASPTPTYGYGFATVDYGSDLLVPPPPLLPLMAIGGFLLLEDAFVKCSKRKPFFGGETIGCLDIAFGSSLPWFKVFERITNMKLLDETNTPNLVAWAERFYQDPVVKDVLPDVDKLNRFFFKKICV